MSDKTIKINPGGEIVITVASTKTSAPPAPSNPPPQKAMIRSPKTGDFLPRRLSVSGFLNFYDTGQIRAGENWNDLDFTISTPLDGPNTLAVQSPTAADYARLPAQLLQVDLAEWKNNYRRLDYDNADKYDIGLKLNDRAEEIELNARNDDWVAGGLKNTETVERMVSGSYGAFKRFDTADSDNYKITTEPDYTAAAAVLTLGKKLDVFLVPVLSQQAASSNNLPLRRSLYLNFAANPRRRLLDRSFFKRTWANAASSDANITEINDWIGYYKAKPLTRAFEQNGIGENVTAIPAAGFPAVSAGNDLSGVSLSFNPSGQTAGMLAAVIQSGGASFFVWTKTAFAGFYFKQFLLTKSGS